MNKKNIPSNYSRFEIARSAGYATLLPIFLAAFFPAVLAEQEALQKNSTNESITVEVEVRVTNPEHKGKNVFRNKKLSHVSYNKDKSLFVGYYQDGWSEMISLHDTKTKRQLGSVYCDGGVPTVFRFSKDNNFLGAKASVGWYVWKIPSFEEVIVLGETDFVKFSAAVQQDGTDQPATVPELDAKGGEKPKPESKVHSQ